MKIKVSKHKLNIHYRGAPWGSRTQQHAYCLRYAHSQHIESHLGKKQPQAEIAITFLFSQLHFNNVTSHALFYGGHLVMRSKRCAVQNKGITLKVSVCSRSNWNFEALGFEERGKPEYPEKSLSDQGREPTTNSNHIRRRRRDLNPGHTGRRRMLSALGNPCSPLHYI